MNLEDAIKFAVACRDKEVEIPEGLVLPVDDFFKKVPKEFWNSGKILHTDKENNISVLIKPSYHV